MFKYRNVVEGSRKRNGEMRVRMNSGRSLLKFAVALDAIATASSVEMREFCMSKSFSKNPDNRRVCG